MRLGVVADIHGNAAALDAVLADAAPFDVQRWWALGDLVLFGPRPAEVLETLTGLPDVEFVSGNTDRYVVTGEQPHPHARAADAVGSRDLVERYAAMAAGIGWTQGALCDCDWLDWLEALPAHQRLSMDNATRVLGVHASPASDDGDGINNDVADDKLAALFEGCEADVVIGGHTHDPTDRAVGSRRALNPGSASMPRHGGGACWMLIDDEAGDGIRVEHRRPAFDVEAVITDMKQRRHPNAGFIAGVLRRTQRFGR